MLTHILVCRTDDLAGIDEFLQTVRTPARHTGDGKKRSEQLLRDTQHCVHKTAVKVHIGTDRLNVFR